MKGTATALAAEHTSARIDSAARTHAPTIGPASVMKASGRKVGEAVHRWRVQIRLKMKQKHPRQAIIMYLDDFHHMSIRARMQVGT